MCGRYGFSVKDAREVYDRFGVMNKLVDFQPRYNIAPGQYNPVILRHSPTSIERMFWGLIPHWAKDETMKYKTINARVEGISDKPPYRKPFRFQRCLVPATGFFEWDKSVTPSLPTTSRLFTNRFLPLPASMIRGQTPRPQQQSTATRLSPVRQTG
jgi:putative SOS response-associated peptidase YedK